MLRPLWSICVMLPLAMVAGSKALAADPIFPAGARLETLWEDGEFTEGVAAAPDGRIYFSDITESVPGRILRFDPRSRETVVHSADSGKSNGLDFDGQGRLIAACGANDGRQALCEITPDGQVRPLVERFEGRRFNAPNDLAVHPRGWIYFSDPRYVGSEPIEIDHMSVYRFDPETQAVVRVTRDISKPNGVIIAPDGGTLYVAETDNGAPDVPGAGSGGGRKKMTLNAFPIADDGALGERRILRDFGQETGIDGMTVDDQGRIYGAVRAESRFGIGVFDPQSGEELAFLPTATLPTNCTFGRGDESQLLYVTAGTGLYRIRVNARRGGPR
ncbi:MAG: SMP-30/gluconolactonase/LRE family protein [Planctomyces sp.]|nr:SMP-30/gluconolactonase/LRE family protein [Planctomyces sp.]